MCDFPQFLWVFWDEIKIWLVNQNSPVTVTDTVLCICDLHRTEYSELGGYPECDAV